MVLRVPGRRPGLCVVAGVSSSSVSSQDARDIVEGAPSIAEPNQTDSGDCCHHHERSWVCGSNPEGHPMLPLRSTLLGHYVGLLVLVAGLVVVPLRAQQTAHVEGNVQKAAQWSTRRPSCAGQHSVTSRRPIKRRNNWRSNRQFPLPLPANGGYTSAPATVFVVTGASATGLNHRALCPWLKAGSTLLTLTLEEATKRYFQAHCLCVSGHEARSALRVQCRADGAGTIRDAIFGDDSARRDSPLGFGAERGCCHGNGLRDEDGLEVPQSRLPQSGEKRDPDEAC